MVLGFSLLIRLNPFSSTLYIILTQIIAGVGTGLSYPGPLLALQTQMPAQESAVASSTMGFLRSLSTAISVVISGVMFQNGMQSQSSYLGQNLGKDLAELFSGKDAAVNVNVIAGLSDVKKDIVRAAYAAGLKRVWILFTCTVCIFYDFMQT